MAIARTVDWRLTIPVQEADARVRAAFDQLGLAPSGAPGHIVGKSKMNFLKNRWSATVTADVTPYMAGSLVALRVEMPAGTKHYTVASDIASAIGEDAFDDRGLTAAKDRLSRISKVGGWLELRHVRNFLTPTETVLELGQGTWGNDQGLVVLTDERLFFFDKTLMGATIQEFPLPAITSLTVNKKLSGEALAITVAGNVSTITQMMHGQGDALSRAFRQAKTAPVSAIAQAPTVVAASSDADELAKLAGLRDRGILTEEEFQAKKAQILGL
jgi:Short C-terminal domain/Bacterial PH domain